MNAAKKKVVSDVLGGEQQPRPTCGVVRPIADMGDYTFAHWENVHDIVCEAAADAGYDCRVVSENESVGVILGNIVSNLYNDPVVICDVSGKNPNVMFELGMRIAFEKPVIIITDDTTGYSFDISPVKHLTYPRTLRYERINTFKEELSGAIVATVDAHSTPGHRGYLQQFGPIKVAELATRELDTSSIVSGMQEMNRAIRAIENRMAHAVSGNISLTGSPASHSNISRQPNSMVVELKPSVTKENLDVALNEIRMFSGMPLDIEFLEEDLFRIRWKSFGAKSRSDNIRQMVTDMLKPMAAQFF